MKINVSKFLVTVFCLVLMAFNAMSAYCNEYVSPDAAGKDLESAAQQEIERLKGELSRGSIDEYTYKGMVLRQKTNAYYQSNMLKKIAAGEITPDQFNKKMGDFRVAEKINTEKTIKLVERLLRENAADDEISRKAYENDLEFYSQYLPVEQMTALGIANAPVSAPKNASSSEPSERLKKLKSLLDQGLITQKDYDTQREAIIKSL